MAKSRVVLAFSGGLDTSAIVPWLKDTYDAEVIAYCSDLGNSPDEEYLTKWSKEVGAVDFIFEDVRDEFCERFAYPAVRAGAIYQDDYLLGTALGRPLIAERMAYFAKKLNADALAHGATGKGNDQVRFERAWAYLAPDCKVIAPWKIWDYTGRSDLLNYLESKGLTLSSEEKLYSIDVNLFHRSCEGGILESPSKDYDVDQIYEWVKPVSKTSSDAINANIKFERGLPVQVNGENLGPAALLEKLNQLAGDAGVGVVDLVEERGNGIKSRGIYETPGGTLLFQACKSLKHLCWDRNLLDMSRSLGHKYADLVYDGLWHNDCRQAMEGFFEKAAETLTGEIGLQLLSGTSRVTSRNSPYALYSEELVSFESDDYQLHKHSEGYCKTISFGQMQAGKRDERSGREYLGKLEK